MHLLEDTGKLCHADTVPCSYDNLTYLFSCCMHLYMCVCVCVCVCGVCMCVCVCVHVCCVCVCVHVCKYRSCCMHAQHKHI